MTEPSGHRYRNSNHAVHGGVQFVLPAFDLKQEDIRIVGDALVKHAEAWPVGLKDDFASPFETIFAAWWHLRGQQGRRGHEGAELDLFVVLPPKERTCLVLGSTCRAGTTC